MSEGEPATADCGFREKGLAARFSAAGFSRDRYADRLAILAKDPLESEKRRFRFPSFPTASRRRE
jgi:hypothetical protein